MKGGETPCSVLGFCSNERKCWKQATNQNGLVSVPAKKADVTGLLTSAPLNQINELIGIVTRLPFLNRSEIIVKKKQGQQGCNIGKEKKTHLHLLLLSLSFVSQIMRKALSEPWSILQMH